MKNKKIIIFIQVAMLFLMSTKKVTAYAPLCSCGVPNGVPVCQCDFCGSGTYLCCIGTEEDCASCFTPETLIDTPGGEMQIKDLRVGEKVQSYNSETEEETTSVVEKIYELTREAYYKIKLKDGTEVKVTAEHPLYAIKGETEAPSFWEYLKTESLTRRLVDRIFK